MNNKMILALAACCALTGAAVAGPHGPGPGGPRPGGPHGGPGFRPAPPLNLSIIYM